PLSAAEAVIRYWNDFVPSWAGAISIDLLPVVLVLVLMVVHDAMRREAGNLEEAETISAAEMFRAVNLYRRLQSPPLSDAPTADAEPQDETAATVEARPPATTVPDAAEATVTPIEAGQRKRGDGPGRT